MLIVIILISICLLFVLSALRISGECSDAEQEAELARNLARLMERPE